MKTRWYIITGIAVAGAFSAIPITRSGKAPEATVSARETTNEFFKVQFPEVRKAAAEDPGNFIGTARQAAGQDVKLLTRFAEIGINAGLRDEPGALLGDALAGAKTFNEYFHIMRLAFACGDRTTAEAAVKRAEESGLTDFQQRKLKHFHDIYEKQRP